MKGIVFKISFGLLFLGFCHLHVDAQRKAKKRTGSAYGSSYGSAYGNSSTTNSKTKSNSTQTNTTNQSNTSAYGNSAYGKTDTTHASAYGATTSGNMAIDTTLPVEVIKGGGGLLNDTKPSLRNDNPFVDDVYDGAVPLAYQTVRQSDVPFKIRVWREIDTREKLNRRFNYDGEDDQGNRRFINVLLKAIRDDSLTAFDGSDDRFTTPITFEQAMSKFGGGMDTTQVYDMQGNVSGYQVRNKAIDPDSIYKFRIKEDWFFDRNTSKLYCRIIGIAPVMSYKLSNGQVLPNSETPLFWLYYPDLRQVLVRTPAYNPYNPGASTSWDDIFESREFSSYIVKSDWENPKNAQLKNIIKDPVIRLYEGDRIKNHIFDYEQSLWSY
ncbi:MULTISPECIES: type IX secretion system ring protein PorN/GldN [Chitinophagaceae]